MPENISGIQLTVAKLRSIIMQLAFFIMKRCTIFNHRIFYGDYNTYLLLYFNILQTKNSTWNRKFIQVISKFELEFTWLFPYKWAVRHTCYPIQINVLLRSLKGTIIRKDYFLAIALSAAATTSAASRWYLVRSSSGLPLSPKLSITATISTGVGKLRTSNCAMLSPRPPLI